MSISRHSTLLLKLLPIIVIFSTAYYFFHFPGLSSFDYDQRPVFESSSKERFIQDVVNSDINGPADNGPLRELCAKTTFTPGLIIRCLASPGGMGNVRSMTLNCYRFAIEAGASGIIIPEMVIRGEDSLSNLYTDNDTPIEYMFDRPHFIKFFTTACPQMHLYNDRKEVAAIPSTSEEFVVDPFKLGPLQEVAATLLSEPENWRKSFYGWLHEHRTDYTAEKPVLVAFPMQLLRFPFSYDTNDFVATFGRLLLIREDIRQIAGSILFAMNEKFNLGLNPEGGKIEEGKFYGAHLRTASDAIAVGWPGYDKQAPNYLRAANMKNLSVIYLTSGNPVDAKKFTDEGKSQGITVISKEELLAARGYEKEKKMMEALTWDQRGIIDYEVLLRCSYFGGMYESSFTWNLWNKRHVVVGNGTWVPISRGDQGLENEDGPEAVMDKLSVVYGPVDLIGVRWQFPWGLYP